MCLIRPTVFIICYLMVAFLKSAFPKLGFVKFSQEKTNIVEELESIMGARAEKSSPLEFLCHRNYSLSLVISGIQTQLGELPSTRAPMINSLLPSRWRGYAPNTENIPSTVRRHTLYLSIISYSLWYAHVMDDSINIRFHPFAGSITALSLITFLCGNSLEKIDCG